MNGFAVVVVAGGRSSRMGTDKALLPVGGRRLVDHVVAQVGTVADEVVVAHGQRPLAVDGATACVADPPGRNGPMAGLVAGMAATSAPVVGLVAVDTPHVSPRVLAALAEELQASDVDAAVPVADGHPQVLHAVYRRRLQPRLVADLEAGHGSLRALLDRVVVDLVSVDRWLSWDPSATFAEDWDTPDDLPPEVRARLADGGPG